MPLADPWFWAFLAATGWGLGFRIVGTQALVREYGDAYRGFQARVPRLIPRLRDPGSRRPA